MFYVLCTCSTYTLYYHREKVNAFRNKHGYSGGTTSASASAPSSKPGSPRGATEHANKMPTLPDIPLPGTTAQDKFDRLVGAGGGVDPAPPGKRIFFWGGVPGQQFSH